MENMDQNLSARIVCPSPKVWDFDEKRLHWASVVRGRKHVVLSSSRLQYQNYRCDGFVQYLLTLRLDFWLRADICSRSLNGFSLSGTFRDIYSNIFWMSTHKKAVLWKFGILFTHWHDEKKRLLQVNIFQKPSFLHQLTHNMARDCSLIPPKNTSLERVVYKYCFECQNKNKKTIFVHNLF